MTPLIFSSTFKAVNSHLLSFPSPTLPFAHLFMALVFAFSDVILAFRVSVFFDPLFLPKYYFLTVNLQPSTRVTRCVTRFNEYLRQGSPPVAHFGCW